MKIILLDKHTEKMVKFHYLVTLLIRLSLIVAIIFAVYEFKWTVLFVSILVFFLTFLPVIFERNYKIDIPVEIELMIVVFLYAALFLGEVRGYYEYYWWWDLLLHGGSALAFGFIGFIILYVLYRGKKINANPWVIAVFSFCFAIAMGTVWEIFEFSMDQLFGFAMQRTGLIDTMWDLIIDCVGALIASLAGYFYLKGWGVFIFGEATKRFVRDNPRLFTKKGERKWK